MDADFEVELDEELRGLDTLEIPRLDPTSISIRAWNSLWPKATAVLVALLIWLLIVWSGFKPPWVLPPPSTVLGTFFDLVGTGAFWKAVTTTMQRAATGFAIAVLLGSVVGLAISQSRILRTAVGSLIVGFQSMPSIVWFPFAILLFGLTEQAILCVVVLGAGPAIASGLISGVDHIPPILLRAGRVLGARGKDLWFRVMLPAALPGYVSGLKQGWAFAWRSLMAGELLVIIAERPSIGGNLHFARELSDAPRLQAMMIVVLLIGLMVDVFFFGTIERRVRRNRGLIVQA